jgi:hypothetical protein
MGWILTASGAIAGTPSVVAAFAPRCEQSPQERLERSEVIDVATGAELRLTRRSNGALQTSLTWSDLDVRKVVQPNGDFSLRLAGRHDLLVMTRTEERLRVTRNGQTAVLLLNQSDEDGLDQVQQVLAGSRAMRAFRSLRRRLTSDSLASAPGVSMDLVDAILGVIHGDPGVYDRRDPAASGRFSHVSFRPNASCFTEYESEVIASWDDFARCVDEVKWFPGLQELCAMTWLLEVESSWFRFIACSSIPLKATES